LRIPTRPTETQNPYLLPFVPLVIPAAVPWEVAFRARLGHRGCEGQCGATAIGLLGKRSSSRER
jgi:hypothetical protein